MIEITCARALISLALTCAVAVALFVIERGRDE